MQNKSCCFVIIFTVIAMLCLVNSSPIINTSWNDSSVFITAGRAMLDGKVMYRDIFDHKGLYIFSINFLEALISTKSLIGVWLIELMFMLANVFIVTKIYQQLYLKCSVLSSQILVMCILFPLVFEGGNFTEEYTLPFQFLTIYLLVKYINSGEIKHSPFMTLIHALNVAIVLNLRPNHVLMWVPVAVIILCRLLYHREYKNILQNFFAAIAGIALGVMPVLVYAVVHDVLYDVIFGTFICNFMYIGTNDIGFFERLFKTIFYQREIIHVSALFFSCLIVFLSGKFKNYRLYYFLMMFMSLITVAMSGRRYGHYYMYLIPFIMPFIFWFADFMTFITRRKFAKVIQVSLTIMLLSYCSYVFITGHQPGHSRAEKVYDNVPVIDAKNKRVLVTGNMAVYYVKLGVTPQEKYFFVPSLPYKNFPEPVDTQANSIISGVNDIILYTDNADGIFSQTGKLDLIHETLDKKYNILAVHNDTKIYGKVK
ncbi:MAG: hypothetical protein IJT58_07375 [Synergistaceae bacterium]|nr:hypothetical protein [Synergistaceae bacterium]